MKLRIHHIFDIIRDYGKNIKFQKHEYGHSYHIIANKLIQNKDEPIQIVIKCDDVCTGCIKYHNGKCLDIITHRQDFTLKEEFNNYLDKRILGVLKINEGDVISFKEIIDKADEYIKNIKYIYDGNDIMNTKVRKENVEKGLIKLQ